MNKWWLMMITVSLIVVCITVGFCQKGGTGAMSEQTVRLPQPRKEGRLSVEAAIARRRSCREFTEAPLTRQQVGQVSWAAQGVTGQGGRKRAVPSAGATYPLSIFLAVGEKGVNGISTGVYRYRPDEHQLEAHASRDVRREVARAALGQSFLAQAPVVVLIAANYARTARRYGDRARRYVHMEAGHASENIYLQAEAEGLCTVAVGAFNDEQVSEVFNLPEQFAPLYLMPIGHPE